MFSKDFYPTPNEVIEQMLHGEDIVGKSILEPSAGKGNIVDWLIANGAKQVIACENHPELRQMLHGKCKLITDDFLTVTPEMVSHIDYIVMNPPFSADEKHILHAWDIAPAGCRVIALCNTATLRGYRTKQQVHLTTVISEHGQSEELGNVFSTAERKTDVNVSLVKLQKPVNDYSAEFEGFFMDDDVEVGEYGVISYNFIRDIVNRYVDAIKIFDGQLDSAIRLNSTLGNFYGKSVGFQCSVGDAPMKRNEFKKDLQKSAWKFVFGKLNMDKYVTQTLRNDINRFVEQQTNVPFTMKNVYKMLEIIVGTHEGRMDRALLDVFDRLTMHTHQNRYNVEGWKTNSHYLINTKFIIPYIVEPSFTGKMSTGYNTSRFELVEDMQKALCYITGENYDEKTRLYYLIMNENPAWGQWFDWGFFECRGYKKGTMHFKFKDEKVWELFNRHISRVKGYPLFEAKKSK